LRRNLHHPLDRATFCLQTPKPGLLRLPSGAPRRDRSGMPSVIKFLVILVVLAGLGYAGIWALANLVEPQPREIIVTIPADRLGK